MPVQGYSFSLDSSGKASRGGAGAGRKALLIGTSLLVYAVFPSAALAQQECGPPPVGGGTVTCSPSGNPYGSGISYPNEVEDLTVVLQPGVQTLEGLNITSGTGGVDLRLEGQTNTSVNSTLNGAAGVNIVSTQGTVFAGADDVTTQNDNAPGINASSRDGSEVVADLVSTLGANSAGVVAIASSTGPVSVTTNSILTQGDNSAGIIASSGGAKYNGGPITVNSGNLVTTGRDSDGIVVTANASIPGGTAGPVTINSGALNTSCDYSTGILVTTRGGSVAIDGGSVATTGYNAAGIVVTVNTLGPNSGNNVSITMGSVDTHGLSSDAVRVSGGSNSVYLDL